MGIVFRDRPSGRGRGFGGLGEGVRHWRVKGPKGIFGRWVGGWRESVFDLEGEDVIGWELDSAM